MKTITLLLLGFALAVGAVAQDETKKSDEKKSEKKAAASNDKLQADLVTKEKALWDAWGKKDGKPFVESMNPDTVGVDAVNGISIGRDTAVKQVTTHNCEVKSYNLSDEKVTPIDKDAVILTYKADQDCQLDLEETERQMVGSVPSGDPCCAGTAIEVEVVQLPTRAARSVRSKYSSSTCNFGLSSTAAPSGWPRRSG